jgi:hypothetical protein
MRTKLLLVSIAVLGSLALLIGPRVQPGPVYAQDPAPQGQAVIQAAVGTAFTYQGRLLSNGEPLDGVTCQMYFVLWDAESDGGQIGTTQEHSVTFEDGYFTVQLDFGADVFQGEARWLEVGVRCPPVQGPLVWLEGRVPLNPTPYALSLRPGAVIRGDGATIIRVENSSADADSTAIKGVMTWVGGETKAVAGYNNSTDEGSSGVYGQGEYYGVHGVSNGIGTAAGVYGESPGTGIGVKASSWSGLGLYASSVTGGAAKFENLGNEPTVTIDNMAGTDPPLQVTGLRGSSFTATSSTDGTAAIVGEANASEGTVYGVYGETQSSSGNASGVKGLTWSGATNGVWGETRSTAHAAGVYGLASATQGTAVGLWGRTHAKNGMGAKIENRGSEGLGLWVGSVLQTNKNRLIEAHQTDASGNSVDRRFLVEIDGDVFADGSFHSGGADFAELFPAVEGLEPGDVLVIGPDGRLTRSTQAYQSTVVGVYSTKPGLVGGATDDTDWAGKVPLAIVGIVPVKASAENGPIRPGDLLAAAATPGHAMHAGPDPRPGTVIGKALEGLEKGTGVIRMLVMLR